MYTFSSSEDERISKKKQRGVFPVVILIHVVIACLICRHRIPKDQWWLNLRPLMRILAKHREKAYMTEGVLAGVDDIEDEDNI